MRWNLSTSEARSRRQQRHQRGTARVSEGGHDQTNSCGHGGRRVLWRPTCGRLLARPTSTYAQISAGRFAHQSAQPIMYDDSTRVGHAHKVFLVSHSLACIAPWLHMHPRVPVAVQCCGTGVMRSTCSTARVQHTHLAFTQNQYPVRSIPSALFDTKISHREIADHVSARRPLPRPPGLPGGLQSPRFAGCPASHWHGHSNLRAPAHDNAPVIAGRDCTARTPSKLPPP